MALLDFIKNRNQPSAEPAEQPKQETAKQMYTRQATEEQTAAKPAEYVRPDQQGRLAEAQALYSKGAQEVPQTTPSATPAPEGTANPQPMKQQLSGQETVAPDLSPTSAQASARAQDVEGPTAPASTPAKSQQQTVARSAPSWER